MPIDFTKYITEAPSNKLAGVVKLYTANSIFMRWLTFDETTEFAKPYSIEASLGGIGYRSLNADYAADLNDVGVVNPAVEHLKVFGGPVRTDRQLSKGQAGKAIRNGNIARKARKAGQFLDREILTGNPNEDPRAITGLQQRLVGNQLLTVDENGGPLTLDWLDNLLDSVVGTNRNKILAMNGAMRTVTKQLILAEAGGAAVADFKEGELDRYNGAKIEVVDEDDRELPILGFDEVMGNDDETCSIYCFRAGEAPEEHMRGLVRMHDGDPPIELVVAKEEHNGGWDDRVEAVMGFALYHSRAAARLRGIERPAP